MIFQGDEVSLENLDALIEHNKGFIINIVSNLTGKYVSIEHDDSYIIALEGFAEAVAKFDVSRGSFLGFVKLVMESRLKTYLQKESRGIKPESLETMCEEGFDVSDSESEEEKIMREEINEYKSELSYFGLSLDILADTAPRHKDTRERAVSIAETAGSDRETAGITYSKKKLPIRAVARLAGVTEKIVKNSKHFILGTMIVFVKRFPALTAWIKSSGGV